VLLQGGMSSSSSISETLMSVVVKDAVMYWSFWR
jgi:hypothetical protein